MSSSAITGPVLSDVRRAPAGTAAAPSFAFNDSTGTGVYLVSAGVLGLSTNGAQRVVVDASGNVGIGTGSPSCTLELAGSADAAQKIRIKRSIGTTNYLELGLTGGDSRIIANGITGTNGSLVFSRDSNTGTPTESMRLDASGNLLVGTTSGSARLYVQGNQASQAANSNESFVVFRGSNSSSQVQIMRIDDGNYNAAACAISSGRHTTTLRSINAGGTINASGADYAEYMTKAGDFTITKGDLCGVNAEGKLTNVFSEAVAFVVKSTNPSYVGGDSWGADFEDDAEGLEAARQKVDRIAFCGQVPVNVLGATPGQWIIPVEENGAIKGQAVSNPSFEQYQLAVGKVIAVEEDGRARIIVKIA